MTKKTLNELKQTITYRPPRQLTVAGGRELIQEFEASGLPIDDFARVIGISKYRIHYWQKRLTGASWREARSNANVGATRHKKAKAKTTAHKATPPAVVTPPNIIRVVDPPAPPPDRRGSLTPRIIELALDGINLRLSIALA